MRLISLTLSNIRSYLQATFQFPEGIVLLSGDIGSGKSTILLAIEFALFGLLRSELSGAALLRNGCMSGSAELTFSLDETTYTIKRTLKRTKNTVEQDAGYLLAKGVKKDATPIELKSAILDLLGYPSELLSKGKNIIYRYTVYTPQEEMKRILLETPEERLNLLRKVFAIDKYARINENTLTYAKTLRERKRSLDVLSSDFEEKQKQFEEQRSELAHIQETIQQINPELESERKMLSALKEQILLIETQKHNFDTALRELHGVKTSHTLKSQQHKTLTEELLSLQQQLLEPQPEVEPFDSRQIQQLTQKIPEVEQTLRTTLTQSSTCSVHLSSAEQLKLKIQNLAQCPTCLQDVDSQHKEQIISEQENKIKEFSAQKNQHVLHIKETEQNLARLKIELEKARTQLQHAQLIQLKAKHHEELQKRKNLLSAQLENITIELALLAQKIKTLEDTTSTFKTDDHYTQLRLEFETRTNRERSSSITLASLLTKQQTLAHSQTLLETELARKTHARKKLEKNQHLHHWLLDFFVPLVSLIEKHVLLRIHHEFNTLFQQWFGMLVEELMTARLDETFSPLILQNGYEVGIDYLSGGERTACALAYRLALNKTINTLISSIKTKDLIILDEPTDGFSSEQLDNMRDVFEQLHLKQIIIVSHEQKIESFANTVLRVSKQNHTSSIAQVS